LSDLPPSSRAIRVLTAGLVAGLAAAAAYISFHHGYDVVRAHGGTGDTAVLTPLTIDGLVLVAGLVILDAALRGEVPPRLAVAALALGIGATLGINILYGASQGVIGGIVAGWPAVVLVLTTELLMGMVRRGNTPATAPAPVVTTDMDDPGSGELFAEIGQALEDATPGPVALEPELLPLVATARDRFAEVLATGETPSVNQLRATLRVGHPRARAIHDALVPV